MKAICFMKSADQTFSVLKRYRTRNPVPDRSLLVKGLWQ